MGNSSDKQPDPGAKKQELTEELLRYSKKYGSTQADDVSLGGINAYLDKQYGPVRKGMDDKGFEHKFRYDKIEELSGEIGMSDGRRGKLLSDAFRNLNRTGELDKAEVPDPAARKETQSEPTAKPKVELPQHDKVIVDGLTTLLDNPRSYLSLSGQKMEHLLSRDAGTLRNVIHADETFMDATRNFWTLPEGHRQGVVQNLQNNYNEDLCTSHLHLAGTSNRTPIESFLKGKEAAMNAASQGLDIYGGTNNEVLKSFGYAAMGVNLALNTSGTLAGRGADTMAEQTMAFSPDGHSNTKKGPVL